MKIKFFFLVVMLAGNMYRGASQCNIGVAGTFTFYGIRSSNDLIYQSAISLPSVWGKSCNGLFSSPLLSSDMSTSYNASGPLQQLSVFPNPVLSSFSIDWNGINLNCHVEIITPLGTKLKSFNRNSGEPISRIDIGGLAMGFYILCISNAEHQYQYSIKLLKL